MKSSVLENYFTLSLKKVFRFGKLFDCKDTKNYSMSQHFNKKKHRKNFLRDRLTNASTASFNTNIKAFRTHLRKIAD